MSIATRPRHRWDTREYAAIRSARYADGDLIVRFEDDTEARVPVVHLRAPHIVSPDWAAVTVGPIWLNVPTADGVVEVSWLSIRALTDPEFDAHLTAAAVEQQRRVGRRIADLRRRQGLGVAQLADRADVSPQLLQGIETGEHAIDLPALQRLVTAMGRSLQDLAVPEGDLAG